LPITFYNGRLEIGEDSKSGCHDNQTASQKAEPGSLFFLFHNTLHGGDYYITRDWDWIPMGFKFNDCSFSSPLNMNTWAACTEANQHITSVFFVFRKNEHKW